MPDVSVIIPTHDRKRLLDLTIQSVLWQRDVDFELLVVDDGSSDGTRDAVRKLDDPRVRLLRHDVARGVSAARNHGVEEARGRWVAFLDDDDLWSSLKLPLQVDALRETGLSWAFAGTVEISMNNRVFDGRPPFTTQEVMKGLSARNMVHAGSSNVVVERRRLPQIVFDGSLHHSPDWDLWIRLARQGPPARVAKPLVAYRLHPGNESLDLEGMFAEADEIERRYGGPVDRGQFCRYLGTLCLKTGWNREALRYYRRATKVADSHYGGAEYLLDVWEVLTEALRGRTARVGIRLPSLRWPGDPHRAWKDEAQAWVDQLIHQARM